MIRDGSVSVRRRAASQDSLAGQERYLPTHAGQDRTVFLQSKQLQSPFGRIA
jgi:hypothetical protein